MEKYTISRLSKEYNEIRAEVEADFNKDSDKSLYEKLMYNATYIMGAEECDMYLERDISSGTTYMANPDVNILSELARYYEESDQYILGSSHEFYQAIEYSENITVKF